MKIEEVEEVLARQGLKTKRIEPNKVDFELQKPGPDGSTDLGWLRFHSSGYPDTVCLRTSGHRELGLKLAAIFLDCGFDTVILDNEQPCGGGEW